MNEKKYKVYNRNKFPVGIKLQNPVRDQNVTQNSFTLLTLDEIAYLDSVSTLFKRGMLICDDNEVNVTLGNIEKNANVISDEEIESILKGNFTAMKKRFEQITEIYARSKITEVFKKIGGDLPLKKGKWIEKYIGKEIFFDEIA